MTDKNETFVEQLKGGTMRVFFDSFPSDEELANHLNSLYPGEGEILADTVRYSRQRFSEAPSRGEVAEDKIASPTKSVIQNKAKQLNIIEALAEIIDNIFDNYERNNSATKPQKLGIKITAYRAHHGLPSEIVIEENSGGIPKDRILPLIQLGSSDRGSAGIGAWGEGFKIAAFAIAHEVEVFSAFPGQEPRAILFPKGWLDKNHPKWTDWKVEVYKVARNPPSDGSTRIHLRYIHSSVGREMGIGEQTDISVSKAYSQDLAKYFGEIYSEKYQNLLDKGFDAGIDVDVGGNLEKVEFLDCIETRLKRTYAFLPWLLPVKWTGTFNTQLEGEGSSSNLSLTIYAGLAATPENYSDAYASTISQPGIEMWGNGRKFSLKERISDESAGWEYKFGGSGGTNPKAGASYRRITVVASFTADDSRDIPWAAPVKNDYNRRSHFYAEIRESLARAIRLYKDSHRLLDSLIIPFSESWTTLSDQQKIDLLFKDTKDSAALVDDFKRSRFCKKPSRLCSRNIL